MLTNPPEGTYPTVADGGLLQALSKHAGRERTTDGVGPKRQQVQGAEVFVAHLRKTRSDVLIGSMASRDVGVIRAAARNPVRRPSLTFSLTERSG